MDKKKTYTAIGLMSGTSLDGIDAALIRTDGYGFVEPLDFAFVPYEDELREDLRRCLGRGAAYDDFVRAVEQRLTLAHAAICHQLMGRSSHPSDSIDSPGFPDLIGFHGHTILHNSKKGGGEEKKRRLLKGQTIQIGDGALLAQETGVDVVCDFRSADVAAGGQGAPLIPLYHAALAVDLEKPVAILNIGGVANVTWLGKSCHIVLPCHPREGGDPCNNEIIAFDTGPGNALIDDWVKQHTGARYDKDGALAAAGVVDEGALQELLDHSYFDALPPKSLDRDTYHVSPVVGLSLENGAATLTAFTVQALAKSLQHFPQPPKTWYVTGGGRLNKTMMDGLQAALEVPVKSVDSLGWNGDALEAEGFAYLAVRSVLGLPLSLPSTTGVKEPLSGGVLHKCFTY